MNPIINKACVGLLFIIVCWNGIAQTPQSVIKTLYDEELGQGEAYRMLEFLSTKIGHRLSGSDGAAAAVEWSATEMREFADTVWLQPVMVPQWKRGPKELARIITGKSGAIPLQVCALGGSVGTGKKGIEAQVVEVRNFEELKSQAASIPGKIVFFNRPLDATVINTFSAYSGAVDQRGSGPSEAARLGAIGVIVRSMGPRDEDYPHTGSLRYAEDAPKIPAIAVSTRDAEVLSAQLKKEKDLRIHIETHCEILEDVLSHNVIGQLIGTDQPERIIVVSGHLDSWDVGQGAHDDGAGCVQAMEVLRLFRAVGYRPRNTIRAVLYMNEENGLRGGREYAAQAELKNEMHVCAIESDRGGFTPRGFTISATQTVRQRIQSWKPLLEPYGLTDFSQEGGGADISFLARLGVPLLGYLPDSQRYFSYHHSAEDTFDKVNQRELGLGAAGMAALIYLIDKNGLE